MAKCSVKIWTHFFIPIKFMTEKTTNYYNKHEEKYWCEFIPKYRHVNLWKMYHRIDLRKRWYWSKWIWGLTRE